jgi:hypothetical protein
MEFDNDDSWFYILPNPTTNMNINVYFQELGSEAVTIRIFNMIGREVYSKVCQTENGRLYTQLLVSPELEQGAYIVDISSAGKEFKQRLMINN